MPKELICTGPLALEWREYDEPELAPNEVRIRSEFSAPKHGTEMQWFAGVANHRGRFDPERKIFLGGPEDRSPYPNKVGNMFCGTIVEVGDEVSELSVGERVFAHGPFRDTHVKDASKCRRLPDGMPWQSALCLDPAQFALGAVRDGHVRAGDVVAVSGMGAIGLMVVQIARASGAACIVAIDPLPNRREAATRSGADLVVNPLESDAALAIREVSDDRGADVCIDYSGHRAALQQALRGVALGGNVVCGAAPGLMDAGLDLGAEAHKNTPNIIFSRACTDPNRDHPRWSNHRIIETAFDWLASGKITGVPVIDPIVGYDSLIDEYPKVVTDPGQNVKLGVRH